MKRQFVLSSLLIILVYCQQNNLFSQKHTSEILRESIKLETDKIFDKLVEVRRYFHKNPELAGKEKQAQEFIKQYLLGLGIAVKTDIYGYGIVGILKGDKKVIKLLGEPRWMHYQMTFQILLISNQK